MPRGGQCQSYEILIKKRPEQQKTPDGMAPAGVRMNNDKGRLKQPIDQYDAKRQPQARFRP